MFFQLCKQELNTFTIRIYLILCIVIIILSFSVESKTFKDLWITGAAILILILVYVMVLVITRDKVWRQKHMHYYIENNNDHDIDSLYTVVVRNGIEQVIDSKDIIIGDLVKLSVGYTIPCDGIFAYGTLDLKTDEKRLTGESKEVRKNRFHPLIMAGTQVSSGEGFMIAVALGDYTQYAQLMRGYVCVIHCSTSTAQHDIKNCLLLDPTLNK